MNTLNNAFLTLVKTINDDALKVFDSALTYILRFLSIDQQEDISWNYTEEDNRAFADFMFFYFQEQKNQVTTKFWHDAWGDLFMELSGNFKSFRGQFFTPAGVSTLCAKMTAGDSTSNHRPVINDCACGSARMLLAADQSAYEKEGAQPYLIGEDIDGMCCKMAAINLAVHGCLGEIIRHDSLQDPDNLLYGYRINETLAAGINYPSIRRSENKMDFIKFRI